MYFKQAEVPGVAREIKKKIENISNFEEICFLAYAPKRVSLKKCSPI